MKIPPAVGAFVAALAVAGCTTVTVHQSGSSPAPAASPAGSSSAPGPAATNGTPTPSTPGSTGNSAPAGTPVATSRNGGSTPPGPVGVPNVTNPWAVVSAYYGDIESGDYSEAWALINSGAVTGQTYQQFVNGFACTGAQQLTEKGQSGDRVSFALAATNTCTGRVQYFAGTDTVQNGVIVAANVRQTGP